MIKRNIIWVCKAVFLLCFIGLALTHKRTAPRIMIIHSYHESYSWVGEENSGVRRFLDKHPEVNLYWMYMDLKRHDEQAFRRTAAGIVHNTIARWHPDVLIIFDDIAQDLVGKRYVNQPGINVVFGGVNSEPERYHYARAKNVTGVLERKPLRAIDDTINMLWKVNGEEGRSPRTLLIGDASFDFAASLSEYEGEGLFWRHTQWLTPQKAKTFDEWKALVLRAPNVADFLMVSDYRQLRYVIDGNKYVPPDEVMRWTERNAKIPVLGLTTASTQDGGMIGIAAAGYEQGLLAAEKAYAIVSGKPASQIPIEAGHHAAISLRKSAMERRGIEPPAIYESYARAMGLYYD